MHARTTIVLSIAALTSLAGSAGAAITSVTGQTVWLTGAGNPPNAGPGFLTGLTAFAWDEQQGIAVANVFANETQNPGGSTSPIPGFISGTVDSHMIHCEQIPGAIFSTGTVTFNGPIVGVIFQPLDLDSTDVLLGKTGTIYPTTFPFRGLPSNSFNIFTVVGNTLSFTLSSVSPVMEIGQLRVLTVVPTPGAAALLGAGGLLALRRRRRA